jgi:hypothetical protein
MQRAYQVDGKLLTLIDFDLPGTPINAPVFQDATP